MLAVDRLGQHQQLLLGQRADQRIAGAGLDPVEHAQVALALVAEGGVGGRVRLAQVDGDAQALRVLVHQLRALAAAVGQQAPADELEAQPAQVEQRDAEALREFRRIGQVPEGHVGGQPVHHHEVFARSLRTVIDLDVVQPGAVDECCRQRGYSMYPSN